MFIRSRSSGVMHHLNRIWFWRPHEATDCIHWSKKLAPGSTGGFSLCALGAFSPENRCESLLHHDLAVRIERALYADALAFKLRHVGLMVDVIHLAGVVFQHVLVTLLYDGSREGLRS